MKIKYTFDNGETSEVEVSEEIGNLVLESRRKEENGERKHRYHCISLDAFEYEGTEFADPDSPESLAEEDAWITEFYKVLNSLTEVQKRRVMMLGEGISLREIARREGVSLRQVQKSVAQTRKKFEKFHF